MVTTVGTGSDLKSVIENFILLERDAIAAYDATIERLKDPVHKEKVREFRSDHERHVRELTDMARRHGASIPAEGDMKEMLTTGKVKMANLTGSDSSVLKAMSTNETDTIDAYEQGANNPAIPPDDRPVFEQAAADERRHKSYMDTAADRGA